MAVPLAVFLELERTRGIYLLLSFAGQPFNKVRAFHNWFLLKKYFFIIKPYLRYRIMNRMLIFNEIFCGNVYFGLRILSVSLNRQAPAAGL